MTDSILRNTRRGKTSVVVIVIITVASLMVVVVCCGGMSIPALFEARAAAQRMSSMNNLKQIGLAIHNYHDTYGALPPAVMKDKDGKPMHSWRIYILPFLEQGFLYDQYDFDEPWDGPNNSMLIPLRPDAYRNPRFLAEDVTTTTYQAISGPGASFDPTVPFLEFGDLLDGYSNCAFVAENFAEPVIWTKPDDTSPADFLSGATVGDAHLEEILVLNGDGRVQGIQKKDLPQVKSLTTRAAGD